LVFYGLKFVPSATFAGMKQQDYQNHIFYYWPHHFMFYGAVLAALALCSIGMWRYEEQRIIWAMMAAMVLLIVWLAYMVRQHYALGNQDRTVRLELRLRYYILTGRRLEEIEAQLSFAPDAELPALADSAVAEKLSPDGIKRRIKHWLPDTMRV
jgi:hypothetical protein